MGKPSTLPVPTVRAVTSALTWIDVTLANAFLPVKAVPLADCLRHRVAENVEAANGEDRRARPRRDHVAAGAGVKDGHAVRHQRAAGGSRGAQPPLSEPLTCGWCG
jgi:hypothetical protein